MNDSQVLVQLGETDAYAADTEMPAEAWSRETARSEIELRIGVGATAPVRTTLSKPRGWSWRRGALVAAAGFAAALLVVGAVSIFSNEPEDTATTTSEPATTTTTVDPGPAFDAIPPFRFGETPPGLVRTTSFAVPFSFDTGSADYVDRVVREDWLTVHVPRCPSGRSRTWTPWSCRARSKTPLRRSGLSTISIPKPQ